MKSRFRYVISGAAAILVLSVATEAQWSASTRYLKGQSLQPVYEGWEQNSDGTYTMWFGYLNRNWDERLAIPVGPENNMQPGAPDRGQPTIFLTGERRRQYFAFKVTLPADWPKDRDLVWTVTANGVAQKAIGSLWPVWLVSGDVVSANRGAMRDTDPNTLNKPPVIAEPAKDATIAVGSPLTLTMGVTDDDMPKRRRPGELVAGGGSVIPQTGNREGAGRGGRGRGRGSADGGPAMRDSLRVTWVQWRGPGTAKFEPDTARVVDAEGKQTGTSGKATTAVTFDKPGTYVIKAYAEDMSLFTIAPEVTVTVTGGGPSTQQ
jgi:hypothetical protein